jgi:hypothetical protein
VPRYTFRSPIGGAHLRPAGVTVVEPKRKDDDFIYPGDVVESEAELPGALWERVDAPKKSSAKSAQAETKE